MVREKVEVSFLIRDPESLNLILVNLIFFCNFDPQYLLKQIARISIVQSKRFYLKLYLLN